MIWFYTSPSLSIPYSHSYQYTSACTSRTRHGVSNQCACACSPQDGPLSPFSSVPLTSILSHTHTHTHTVLCSHSPLSPSPQFSYTHTHTHTLSLSLSDPLIFSSDIISFCNAFFGHSFHFSIL